MKCIGKSWKCTVIRQISTTYRLLLLKKEEVTQPKRSKRSLVLLVPVAFKSRGKVTKAKEKVTKSRGKVTKSKEKVTKSRKKSNQVQDSDTQLRHSDTKKVSLSNKQRDIVNFCSVPRTTAEIMERLGLSNQTKNRERYITSLVAAGYLQMTNPENPTASNQKYKKVTTTK